MTEHALDRSGFAGSFGTYLRYALAPIAALVLLASVAFLAALVWLDPALRAPREAAVLLLYLLLFHAAVVVPLAVATLVVLAALRARGAALLGRRAVGACVVGVSLFSLMALNAALRFTLTYTFYRAERLLTPLGVANQLVLLAGAVAVFWLLFRFGTRDAPAGRGRRAVVTFCAWAVVALGVLAINLSDEMPRVPNLDALAPAAAPAEAHRWGTSEAPANVLVLGFDGLSWYVVASMLREGGLPNLGMLIRSGTRARLTSEIPTTSPIIWNTIATGRRAVDHGIFGFRGFQLPGMSASLRRGPMLASMNWWNGLNRVLSAAGSRGYIELLPYFNTDRRVPAVWDVAQHYGLSTGVAGWFNTWPVTATSDGSYMVSKFWIEGEGGVLDVPAEAPPPPVPPDSPLWRAPWLEHETRTTHVRVQRALSLYRRARPRLSLNYWHFTDGVQHSFWRGDRRGRLWYLPRESDYEQFSRQVTDSYALVDRWIGGFLDAMEPETMIFVVSDHGYAFDGHEHHQAPDGLFVAAGPGVKPNQMIGDVSLYDLAPTILSVLGLPLSEELEGRVRHEIFAPGTLARSQRVTSYSWYEPGTLREKRMLDVERETWEKMRALGYVN